jgi:hypothetical protein
MAFCNPTINRFLTTNVSHKREHCYKPDFKKVEWDKYRQVLDDLLPNPDDMTIATTLDINLLVR